MALFTLLWWLCCLQKRTQGEGGALQMHLFPSAFGNGDLNHILIPNFWEGSACCMCCWFVILNLSKDWYSTGVWCSLLVATDSMLICIGFLHEGGKKKKNRSSSAGWDSCLWTFLICKPRCFVNSRRPVITRSLCEKMGHLVSERWTMVPQILFKQCALCVFQTSPPHPTPLSLHTCTQIPFKSACSYIFMGREESARSLAADSQNC